MVEVVINIDCPRLNKKLLKELKEDISRTVRLKLAREMLLQGGDKRLENSGLTEEDTLKMGKAANKSALKVWKEKGIL